ncbi:ephrin type-A receptor 4a-like [Dendronephthya gigantea]|uniref:ephrin type-A receptor 4a-like n=1 Tax=Dendronephthya gigantea TaxID=151771 RepID=UPI0010690979|nr:ephrin type-A receptor 4a-like [Dendronephthya gigantea]
MFHRHVCPRWLFHGFLLFFLYSVGKSATTPTAKDDSVDKLDNTIIYIIVGVGLLFLFTVTIVVIVSLYQMKDSPGAQVAKGVERMDGAQRRNEVQGGYPSTTLGQLETAAAIIHRQSGYPSALSDGRPVVVNTNVQRYSGVSNPRQSTASDRPGPEVYVLNDHQRNSRISQDGAFQLSPIIPEERPTWWEIPQDKLKIYWDNVLGSGQFGVILMGEVIKGRREIICAVKTLKREATTNERESLKTELKNMSNMDSHPYIVNLIGAQTRDGEFNVVVEYCANGDLYNYVKKNRLDLSSQGLKGTGTTIEYVTRLRISFDIANGMAYLATKGFIHRDLAARNVLLDGELRAKVSDFGRSRDVSATFKTIQSFRKNEPVPTRWMPVETLRKQEFTSKSDVWSFGVLLWEIESGGIRPYNDLDTYRQVVNKVVNEGYRLQKPYYCPDVIYEIMKECWKIDPDERPTFTQIATNLGNLLQANMPSQIHYTTMPTLPRA